MTSESSQAPHSSWARVRTVKDLRGSAGLARLFSLTWNCVHCHCVSVTMGSRSYQSHVFLPQGLCTSILFSSTQLFTALCPSHPLLSSWKRLSCIARIIAVCIHPIPGEGLQGTRSLWNVFLYVIIRLISASPTRLWVPRRQESCIVLNIGSPWHTVGTQ